MQERGMAASWKDEFVDCVSVMRENLALYRTMVGEFQEHGAKAEKLLMEEPVDMHAVRVKILTVASIVAVMHKSSGGEANKKARMLATDALVGLNVFGMAHFKAPFLDEVRMRPILANDMIDRSERPKKKANRGEGGSASVQT